MDLDAPSKRESGPPLAVRPWLPLSREDDPGSGSVRRLLNLEQRRPVIRDKASMQWPRNQLEDVKVLGREAHPQRPLIRGRDGFGHARYLVTNHFAVSFDSLLKKLLYLLAQGVPIRTYWPESCAVNRVPTGIRSGTCHPRIRCPKSTRCRLSSIMGIRR